MNKTAIKNFAVGARVSLISAVTQRAYEYEITKDGENTAALDQVSGRPLTPTEKSQRSQLIARINEKGFDNVMEEAAYTWFNRFTALRYMEVNGYLPTRIKVFSNENDEFKPEILSQALDVEIEGLDKSYIVDLIDAQDNETLYKYLLIAQCNALNKGLPELFEQIGGWTELLFPRNLLREDSVIARMVKDIPQQDWQDQVQIIGWLYQYYNTEPKDKVFANLKKNIKISKDDIPAATQLFTPDWIVRYMVENSLGRLWAEGHEKPANADWKYYLEEAQQEESVKAELEKLRAEYAQIKPEQIKFLDPCMGSGHILVYAFDVLMDIYTQQGWSERDAAVSIITKNLYGLDIDKRAYQLAYFSLMMKARQYCRRLFEHSAKGECSPNLANFQDIGRFSTDMLTEEIAQLAGQFENCDTYGSLIDVQEIQGLDEAIDEFHGVIGFNAQQLERMMQLYKILSQQYDVVCTNPPYMGGSGMNSTLSNFVKEKFADYKSDLFSAFVVKCTQLAKPTGYTGFLTPYVWMFIQSYEKLRSYIYSSKTIETLIQFEYSAFEEATVPICTFVLKNSHVNKNGCYFRLTDFRGGMEVQRQKTLEAIADHKCGFYYESNAENFSKIPGMPVAYWVSEAFISTFDNKTIGSYAKPVEGIKTGDNDRFLRLWFEVSRENEYLSNNDNKNWKYHKMTKGGSYRKWYGNAEYVCEWGNNGERLRSFHGASLSNFELFFTPAITWTYITSGKFSMRTLDDDFLYNNKGPACYIANELKYYVLGLMNTKYIQEVLYFIAPTIDCKPGNIANIPLIIDQNNKEYIDSIVQENIRLAKLDWDSFETSWDFERHPLV
ncbi:MAG: BREX-1 system adenine-specific DNA-methyltransferase PglX [Ruminococcus sp.]|nr:BREX-1 system adenine-specific DNA-methyltransferase PglX [Ruminococcus sp.]